jgi:hypothetical protein
MFLGAILFMLIFVLLAPQSRAFLGHMVVNFTAFMTAWAPFSYLLLAVLISALLAGFWLIHTWPKYVEPENPMAKYRRDAPMEED